VITELPEQGRLLNHRFAATDLKGWGRYVRIAAVMGGFYLFCDEIEVLRGRHAEADSVYLDPAPIPAEGIRDFAGKLLPWINQRNTTLSLLREADEAVTARAAAVADPAAIAVARRTIVAAQRRGLAERSVSVADYSQGPPYRDADRTAFEAVADLNARLWPGRSVLCWQKGDWDWLRPLDMPPGNAPSATVRVDMMQNEWATASFVLTSARRTAQQLTFAVDDFQGPEMRSAATLLRIGHVVHAEAFGYHYRDDAIVPLSEGPVVLASAVSKRIWLVFKTRGLEVKPGVYRSVIHVAADGQPAAEVPCHLRVWPMRFPDQVTLQSNTWGYFDSPPIVGQERAAAQDLLDHYNTALTLNHGWLPYPRPDRQGNFTQPLDFTRLDRMLAWNPQTRLWLVWAGFEFGYDRLGTPALGSTAWEKVFTQWVVQIRDHFAERGVGKDRFAWYWVDEPGDQAWEKTYLPSSKLLKRVDPQMLIFANPTLRVSNRQLEAALPLVDFYCPNTGHVLDRTTHAICQQTRHKSWMYGCASDKNADPFGQYRWYGWQAWRLRLGGIGMWVYVDAESMTLSDYSTRVSYALVYRGRHAPLDSKRWEAWRQGIADFEYLRLLADAANQPGQSPDLVARARDILTKGVEEVAGRSPHGGEPGQAAAADRWRLSMLQCLEQYGLPSRR
jgi:hypothetical protein